MKKQFEKMGMGRPPMTHFVIGSGSTQTPPAKSITLGITVHFLTFISPAAATSSWLWQMVAMAFLVEHLAVVAVKLGEPATGNDESSVGGGVYVRRNLRSR